MQSPKFKIKSSHLRKLVASKKLSKIWTDSLRDRMRKQIIPDAVEYLDFHLDLKRACDEIESRVANGSYSPFPIFRIKVEKSNGLCRQMALPHPSDALVMQALSDSLWQEIKKRTPCDTAFYAPSDQPFSKKNPTKEDDEFGYGPIESWLDFQQEILKFSKKRNFVVVTDIANYYDFIIHRHLRAILSDFGIEREYALDLLLFVIEVGAWRPDYMPNLGIGLPQMDFDAPRLLAHTHLFEIDELFCNRADVDYARFMDDIDFGVDHIATAKSVLRDLDLALQTRNLRVNSGKTKILTADQARNHFKVIENTYCDRIAQRFESNFYLEKEKQKIGKIACASIKLGRKNGNFIDGNGDKIIKRLLKIISLSEVGLSDDLLRWIMYEKPSLRQNALLAWSKHGFNVSQAKIISSFLNSGQSIDDLSPIICTLSMMSARCDNKLNNSDIYYIYYSLKGDDPSFSAARLLFLSKFDTPSFLFNEIKKSASSWSNNVLLSRQVAGFAPLFRDMNIWDEYVELVRQWGGAQGLSVLALHRKIMAELKTFQRVRPFLAAPNPSVPLKVTHAKTLMMLSALKNAHVPKSERAKLVGIHQDMMSDAYYQNTFSRALSTMP